MRELVLTNRITNPDATKATVERLTVDFKAKTVFVQWLFNDGTAGSNPITDRRAPRIIHALETGQYGVQGDLHAYLFAFCIADASIPDGRVQGTVDEPPPDPEPVGEVEPSPSPGRRTIMGVLRDWLG